MRRVRSYDKKALRRFSCGEIAALIQQALDAGAWADAVSDGRMTEGDLEVVETEMRKEAARFRHWSHR